MVRGGKRKLVNDDNLRPNKVSYNNAKLLAVVQAPIKGRELTSFTFILDHSHQLMTSISLWEFGVHTAILRAVNTSESGSCSTLCDTGEGKLIAWVPESTVVRVGAGRMVASRAGTTRSAICHIAVIIEWQWSTSAVDMEAGVIAWTKGVLAVPIEVHRRHHAAQSQKGERKNHFHKYFGWKSWLSKFALWEDCLLLKDVLQLETSDC